jgi:opacity protein-like surface antigen
MKKVLLASVALVAIGAVTPAMAQDAPRGSVYLGLAAGANWLGDTNPDTIFGDTLDTEFDTGWLLSGAVGYKWPSGLRTELELAYRNNDADSVIEAGTTYVVNGDVSQFSVLVNVLYDFSVAENLNLTLGGGIGGASAAVDIANTSDLLIDADAEWGFAFQLIAGGSFEISPEADVFVEYRYLRNNATAVTYPPPNTPLQVDLDLESHGVVLGIRYAIGG